MARIYLDKNNEFTVKEWKALNIIVAVVFLVLFIFALYNLGFNNWGSWQIFILLCLPILIVAFIYRKKSTSDTVIIRINNEGIFYYGKLITGWDNFQNAYITDEMEIGSYADKFMLVIEFYRDNLLIQRKIQLTNTQDKSEEEVYAAIKYFYKQHTHADTETIDIAAEVVSSK